MTTIVKGGDYIIEGYPDSVVEVLATDMGERWPFLVRAKHWSGADWTVTPANARGVMLHNIFERFIPRPQRTVKRKVWINWYEDTPSIHLTREEADAWANLGRGRGIACTEHELDVPEGVEL